MTYGLIFYEINNNKVYLYLRCNSNEDNILYYIGTLYYAKNSDYNHIIYLLDITKYNDLFEKYKNLLEKINYDMFNQKIFHNNIKHKRIKNFIIKRELDYIILNHNLIKKLKSQY